MEAQCARTEGMLDAAAPMRSVVKAADCRATWHSHANPLQGREGSAPGALGVNPRDPPGRCP